MRKMYHIEVGALSDFLGATIPSFHYEDGLEIIELDGKKLRSATGIDKSLSVKTDAISVIITLSGEARIEIDTEKYKLHTNSILNLIGFKVLRNFNFSDDFKGYHLLLSKSYYDDVFRDGKHLPPESMLYKTRYPNNDITSEESHLLLTCIENIIVHEIALQMHFSDQSLFGRFFKKCTGKSPAAYRRLFR